MPELLECSKQLTLRHLLLTDQTVPNHMILELYKGLSIGRATPCLILSMRIWGGIWGHDAPIWYKTGVVIQDTAYLRVCVNVILMGTIYWLYLFSYVNIESQRLRITSFDSTLKQIPLGLKGKIPVKIIGIWEWITMHTFSANISLLFWEECCGFILVYKMTLQ